ncbi:MAG: S8 family serine peptidase, partial [Bacteroidaceae bacterium]|nr:S8 family serine peptidase [Bacteroidaceae bacterium]
MIKKFLLFGLLMSTGTLGFAQKDVSEKLSVTTQMFLNERNDKGVARRKAPAVEKNLGLKLDETFSARLKKNGDRLYASPEVQNGVTYISTFIRVKNNAELSDLEAKGVHVQCKFNDGLITAIIPVDSLESVANIQNVQRINVSPLMRPASNAARSMTKAGDVLTHSANAASAGLSKVYDGTGVVLGIIDTGIDFQHISFKDKNGNSRIKRAYVYNGSSAREYTSFSSSITTDDANEDHGTHTSSTAGGSSVIINGSNVTVTDNHANATYGGMAPGADLYLAGVNGLSSTYLANAFQKICNYADAQGKPVVVSNSWGSQFGPHDGTGDFASITSQYFGDNNPNHICLFAASNDAGKSNGNAGGYHVSGTATSSNPLGTVIRSHTYSNTDDGYYYYGAIANAWSRSTLSGNLAVKIYVLDSSTGAVKTSVTVTRGNSSSHTVSGLSNYYEGSLNVYFDYINSTKSQILLYSNGLTSKSATQATQNGNVIYKSKYTLAVQFYPERGSSVVDVWGG